MIISELISLLDTIKDRIGDVEVTAGCQSEGIEGEPQVFIDTHREPSAYIDFYGAYGDALERIEVPA